MDKLKIDIPDGTRCLPSDLSLSELCRRLKHQFGLPIRLDNFDVVIVNALPEVMFPERGIQLLTNALIVYKPGPIDERGRPHWGYKPALYIAHN